MPTAPSLTWNDRTLLAAGWRLHSAPVYCTGSGIHWPVAIDHHGADHVST